MAIIIVVISFFFTLFSWGTWDAYMKLLGKPTIEKKAIRFLFVHRGRYWMNEIKVNNSIISLPSKEDLYSISRGVFIAEIISLVYVILIVLLECFGILCNIEVASIIAIVLACIYAVFAIVLFFVGNRQLSKVEEYQWREKYQILVEDGISNKVSYAEAEQLLWQGKSIKFNLYSISFVIQSSEKKLQLINQTHMKIIFAGKDFIDLLKRVEVNGKSLYDLWNYLIVSND